VQHGAGGGEALQIQVLGIPRYLMQQAISRVVTRCGLRHSGRWLACHACPRCTCKDGTHESGRRRPIHDLASCPPSLHQVKARNAAAYQRLRAMCADPAKRFFVFANENHKDTAVESREGESANDRNDRALRTAAAWYAGRIPVSGREVERGVAVTGESGKDRKPGSKRREEGKSCERRRRSPGSRPVGAGRVPVRGGFGRVYSDAAKSPEGGATGRGADLDADGG
jgi:hypothetical protein